MIFLGGAGGGCRQSPGGGRGLPSPIIGGVGRSDGDSGFGDDTEMGQKINFLVQIEALESRNSLSVLGTPRGSLL